MQTSVGAPRDKSTRWGLPLERWVAARDQVRAVLVDRARAHATVTYGELSRAIADTGFSPRSWALMALLGEACDLEDAVHGVWTASLVVRKDSGMPGDGYFSYAEREGRDVSDRAALWHEQVQRVWNAYAAR